ncbi:MAG: WG repeat-containing protein [Aureispira sp.]|nr:WG repeat-containing protein [Aureispira sp.]
MKKSYILLILITLCLPAFGQEKLTLTMDCEILSAPDFDSNILTTLKKGDNITPIFFDKEESYFYVNKNDNFGWMPKTVFIKNDNFYLALKLNDINKVKNKEEYLLSKKSIAEKEQREQNEQRIQDEKERAEEQLVDKEQQYDFVGVFSNGVARCNVGGFYKKTKIFNRYITSKTITGGKWGVVDSENNEVLPAKYNEMNDFEDGRAIVGLENRYDWMFYGIIDKTGKEIVSPRYHSTTVFSEGLIAVCSYRNAGKNPFKNLKSNGMYKWGFIDKNGKTVIPFMYESPIPSWGMFQFKNGVAIVENFPYLGVINKQNKIIIPFSRYSEMKFEGNKIAAKKNHFDKDWIYFDLTGKEIK